MVFPGRFSTGCTLCRQRKVKCDERKPSCRRCAIYGKPCPGYTDQFHFRHSRHGSTASSKSSVSSSSTAPQTPTRPTRAAVESLPLRKPLAASSEETSICYFVSRFVSPDGADGFPGHLSFVTHLYNSHRHGILEMATLAVAQMVAYNRFRDNSYRLEAYKNHGQTIAMLQRAVQDEEEARDDCVIAAVLLLCVFKDLTSDGVVDSHEHASGIYFLVARRGVEQLASITGFQLLIFALLRLHLYSFIHNDDSYNDPGGITVLLGPYDPLIRAMGITAEVLQLRHTVISCIDSPKTNPPTPESPSTTTEDPHEKIFQLSLKTSTDLNDWEADIVGYWDRTFQGRTAPGPLGHVTARGAHYDPETACTVILVRCSRLMLLSSMHKYFTQVDFVPNGDALAEMLRQDMDTTVRDMLACVPYALGDVDAAGRPSSLPYEGAAALVILHAIKLAVLCSAGDDQLSREVDSVVDRLRRAIGLRPAKGCANEMASLSPSLTPESVL